MLQNHELDEFGHRQSEISVARCEKLKRLYDYIEQKRQTQWWAVSSDNLGKIDEVRRS